MEKISVILTVFNRTEYLQQSIKSIINQTYTNFEIIVADDSNSIEIKETCESFNSSKIIYIGNKERLGVASNLKNAISLSEGNYFTILNDDDFKKKNFLEELTNVLNVNKNIDIIFSDHWVVDSKGAILKDLTEFTTIKHGRKYLKNGYVENLIYFVLHYNVLPIAMSSIIKKNDFILNSLTSEVNGSYDLWISYLIASKNAVAWYVPERLSFYRVHEKMETKRKSFDKNIHKIFILNESEKWFPDFKLLFQSKKAINFYNIGKDHIYYGMKKEAKYYFKTSLTLKFSVKVLLVLFYSYLPYGIINWLNLNYKIKK